jgi:hypothetical protein
MHLYLIDSRLYLAVAEQVPDHLHAEVRDSDALDQSLLNQCFQLWPHFVHGSVQLFILSRLSLSGCLDLLHRDGPVDQVKINILKSKLLERPPACSLNILILILPNLCCDEELLSRHLP